MKELFKKKPIFSLQILWLLLFCGLMHYQLWSKRCWCFLPKPFLYTSLNYQENEWKCLHCKPFLKQWDHIYDFPILIKYIENLSIVNVTADIQSLNVQPLNILLWIEKWNPSSKTSSNTRFAQLHWIITDFLICICSLTVVFSARILRI